MKIEDLTMEFNTDFFNKETHDELFIEIKHMPLLISLLKTDKTCLSDWLREIDKKLILKYLIYLSSELTSNSKEENNNSFEPNPESEADIAFTLAALASKNGEKEISIATAQKRKKHLMLSMTMVNLDDSIFLRFFSEDRRWDFDGPFKMMN